MEPTSNLRVIKNGRVGLEEHRYALRKGIRGVEDRRGQLWLYWEDVLREGLNFLSVNAKNET